MKTFSQEGTLFNLNWIKVKIQIITYRNGVKGWQCRDIVLYKMFFALVYARQSLKRTLNIQILVYLFLYFYINRFYQLIFIIIFNHYSYFIITKNVVHDNWNYYNKLTQIRYHGISLRLDSCTFLPLKSSTNIYNLW